MDCYLGEIRLAAWAFDTAEGWMLCDGRQLPIQQYSALYSLLSIQFGGDGKTYFNIPDLRGRTPVSTDGTQAYKVGASGGAETVTLTSTTIPAHTHAFLGTSETADKPMVGTGANRLLGASTASLYGSTAANMVVMDDATSDAGSSQPHNNMQPSQVVGYYIATMGMYPIRP
jgi:microcystin-dependent protein